MEKISFYFVFLTNSIIFASEYKYKLMQINSHLSVLVHNLAKKWGEKTALTFRKFGSDQWQIGFIQPLFLKSETSEQCPPESWG